MNNVSYDKFYQRLALNLISISLILLFIYLAQGILIPFFFSILLAMLLLPLTYFLQRFKIGRVPSILISIFLAFIILAAILYFLTTQIAGFVNDLPTLKEKLATMADAVQQWVNSTFNMTVNTQNQYIRDAAERLKTNSPKIVGEIFVSITERLSYLIFLPVYTFLLLYYKDLIKKFFVEVFRDRSKNKVNDVLHESRTVAQLYVTGLLTETGIVFSLNTLGFLIIGIKYPVFLALVAALLNLVPYVGMIVANIFCVLVTLITSENFTDAIWVAVVLALVQVFDNNFGMPLIVGTKVKINVLATILGVLAGGALCGVAGMFLAIPGLAVIKVICDRIEALKPYGMLLGDYEPSRANAHKKFKEKVSP